MQIKSNIFKRFAVTSALLVSLLAVPQQKAQAQLPVIDWAAIAQLGLQLQQGLQIYNNAVQIYGVASKEASYLKNKQILTAVGFLAQHAMIPGQPGWDKALTAASGIASAASVWQQMTAPGATNSFQTLNNRIKLADSFGTSMLNAIGSCNAAAAQTDGAISSLEQMATDLSSNANTRANQANLGNMGSSQNLRIQECQHNLQMQQAKVQMLNTMQQRDHELEIFNMLTGAAAARSQLTVSNTYNDLQNVVDR